MDKQDTIREYLQSQGIMPSSEEEFRAALVAVHGENAMKTYETLLSTVNEASAKDYETYLKFLAPVFEIRMGLFYDSLVGLQTYLWEELDAYLSQDADAHIVDAGCGTGLDLGWIAARWPRARVLGYDRSVTQTALAIMRIASLDIKNVGILTLPHGQLEFPADKLPVFVFTNCSAGFSLPSCDCISTRELDEYIHCFRQWLKNLSKMLRVGDYYVDSRNCTRFMFKFIQIIATDNGYELTRSSTLPKEFAHCPSHPTDPIKVGAYTLKRIA